MENDVVDENPSEKRRCPFEISSSTAKVSITGDDVERGDVMRD